MAYKPGTVGKGRPHIVLVVPRGEAVRNFLYSDTLRCLAERARVTLLSVVSDQDFVGRFQPFCERIIALKTYPQALSVHYLRMVIGAGHDRWLWSESARDRWAGRDYLAQIGFTRKPLRLLVKAAGRSIANRPSLELLTRLERWLEWRMRPTDYFRELFASIRPDLVFNCSHIHGPAGDLPVSTAHHMGIATAGFIFSWDNLTSRSRIFAPYDYYIVWNEAMRRQLLSIYRSVSSDRVFITGTPQFDFHFKPEFHLSRETLGKRIGADPRRSFVLYTTGIHRHFLEEHRHVETVARLLRTLDLPSRPQLIVRTYAKGTSDEMRALATQGLPDVVFPPSLWDPRTLTPSYDDLSIYSSLLRYTSLGINVASTVSLELLMHDKPVINIGFDPPGSHLSAVHRYERHLRFDHYQPVVESGATMVARSVEDLGEMIARGLRRPEEGSSARGLFVKEMFGGTLDGRAGERVALHLCALAKRRARSASASGERVTPVGLLLEERPPLRFEGWSAEK